MIKKGDPIFEGADFEITSGEEYAGVDDLRALIARKNLSLRKLGAHLGVNASTICRWFSGETRPHPLLMRIFPALLQDLDRLYPDVPEPSGQTHITRSRLAALQRKFIGDTDLWTQALDGLELMPADLFAAILASNAHQSEIEDFIFGFGELTKRYPQISEALEKASR